MKYFAVESILRESPSKVTEAVIKVAASIKFQFKHIECLDTLEIGSTKFHRFRLGKEDIEPLVEALFKSGRGVVSLVGTEYEVRLRTGRKGRLPSTNMLTAPRQQQTYRGPSDPYWERQFTPAE